MKRKLLSLLLVSALVFSCLPALALGEVWRAADFTDVFDLPTGERYITTASRIQGKYSNVEVESGKATFELFITLDSIGIKIREDGDHLVLNLTGSNRWFDVTMLDPDRNKVSLGAYYETNGDMLYISSSDVLTVLDAMSGDGSVSFHLVDRAQSYNTYTFTVADCRGFREEWYDFFEIAALTEKWKPGNYVTFGHYEQDGDTGNGAEDIEWLVLEQDGDTALLISRYALDAKPFNEKKTDVTWETCTMRGWLNGEFYDAAFGEEEKALIITSDVTADKNPSYSTPQGNDTRDNVFLLSITEANKYFADDEARMCAPTEQAVKNGVYQSSNYAVDGVGTCWWWLRSSGFASNDAAIVDDGGGLINIGYGVDDDFVAVRPCVRVRLF